MYAKSNYLQIKFAFTSKCNYTAIDIYVVMHRARPQLFTAAHVFMASYIRILRSYCMETCLMLVIQGMHSSSIFQFCLFACMKARSFKTKKSLCSLFSLGFPKIVLSLPFSVLPYLSQILKICLVLIIV